MKDKRLKNVAIIGIYKGNCRYDNVRHSEKMSIYLRQNGENAQNYAVMHVKMAIVPAQMTILQVQMAIVRRQIGIRQCQIVI
jgi:hypothetical protein